MLVEGGRDGYLTSQKGKYKRLHDSTYLGFSRERFEMGIRFDGIIVNGDLCSTDGGDD